MISKLEDIGFYTLSNARARNASIRSNLIRGEVLLTSYCNFSCPYCRGVEDNYNLSFNDAVGIVDIMAHDGLENIRFSGGEPTIWTGLDRLVAYAKKEGINRIAVSTNGSALLDYYKHLIEVGVSDFSISFDGCCANTVDSLAGIPVFDRICKNIEALSALTYVTVGIVVVDKNKNEVKDIIQKAKDLGVFDIRVIPSAQSGRYLNASILNGVEENTKYPILNYRIKNSRAGLPIRGLDKEDNCQCPLVLDDLVVRDSQHYPCVIYQREGGRSMGNIFKQCNYRRVRYNWYKLHNCFNDPICRNNCLDVCVEYNNMWEKFNTIH